MKKETKKNIWFSVASFVAGMIVTILALVFIGLYMQKNEQNAQKLRYAPCLSILQNAAGYDEVWDSTASIFTYQQANDSNLQRVRQHFNLDSIAGKGDEISQIKNLMYFVHNAVRHDGNNQLPHINSNAIDLIEYCQKENTGMNCTLMSYVLKDMCLAMGIPSRAIHCLPKNDSIDTDTHWINIVYSKTLNKWIWIDPTFAAFVSDEKANLLSIEEVRYRLINNLPLVLNDDANWNNTQKQQAEYYLKQYMAKNLYWLECATESRFETNKPNSYVRLCPVGFEGDKFGYELFVTHNPNYFWQLPEKNSKILYSIKE